MDKVGRVPTCHAKIAIKRSASNCCVVSKSSCAPHATLGRYQVLSAAKSRRPFQLHPACSLLCYSLTVTTPQYKVLYYPVIFHDIGGEEGPTFERRKCTTRGYLSIPEDRNIEESSDPGRIHYYTWSKYAQTRSYHERMC